MALTFRQASLKTWLFVAAGLFLTNSHALARSRDDAIASMLHCAAIGDARLWLDCYYGAAQSVRAQLGLVPANQNQIRLALNPPASTPAGDLSPRYQVTADALRCNSLADDRQWLNCYYAAAQPVRAQLGLSPAPQVPPPLPAGVALASAPAGPAARPGTAGLPSGWSQMASYRFNPYGTFTLVLANGQEWQQLSGDTSKAHWTKPAADYWVRITHGALNSLNLKVRGEAAIFKVQQIR